MNVANFFKNFEFKTSLIEIENVNSFRSKSFIYDSNISDYYKRKKVVAYIYSFLNESLKLYVE